jgi:hypothetical protein
MCGFTVSIRLSNSGDFCQGKNGGAARNHDGNVEFSDAPPTDAQPIE